jgi:hypothetical protein
LLGVEDRKLVYFGSRASPSERNGLVSATGHAVSPRAPRKLTVETRVDELSFREFDYQVSNAEASLMNATKPVKEKWLCSYLIQGQGQHADPNSFVLSHPYGGRTTQSGFPPAQSVYGSDERYRVRQ